MKKTLLVLMALTSIALIGCGNSDLEAIREAEDRIIACPQDAKICQDGSVLTRQGLECEFPACPGEAAAESGV